VLGHLLQPQNGAMLVPQEAKGTHSIAGCF
jgi:hypothetical protein